MADQGVSRLNQPSVKVKRSLTATGCLPLAVGVALSLLVFINLVTYINAPPWVTNEREWRIAGKLLVSFGVLAVLQLIATWVLGLMGAIGGAQAYQAGGDDRRARRLLIGPALGVIALRLLLVGVAAVALGLVVSGSFNPDIDGWQLMRLLQQGRRYAGIMLPVVGMVGLFATVGPFLRARYSVALGLWAAGWPEREVGRPWAAVSARLGAGFAGLFGLIWGTTLALLVWLSLSDPILNRQGLNWPHIMPDAPTPLSHAMIGLVAAGIIAGLVLLGQVFLPWIYRALARRRIQQAHDGG